MDLRGGVVHIDLAALSPGRRCRALRQWAGLTQHELASRLGVAPARINEAEHEWRRALPYIERLRERIATELARELASVLSAEERATA